MNTGESRTDLVGRNIKILSSAIEDMKPFRDDTIIILVTNPVDILTYFAQKLSGLPKNQVIGSGTFLDSARLRGILSQKCGVAASSIEAYVLGEHGDSQMVTSNYHSLSSYFLLTTTTGRMVTRISRRSPPRHGPPGRLNRQKRHCKRHEEKGRRHLRRQRRNRFRYRRRNTVNLSFHLV
jgi:hypothetical protein